MEEILLVDDDLDNLHVVRHFLQGEGMVVRCAESGEQALLELKKKSFHLMITDLNMPGGMNGFELARKASAITPDMPIIMTTGSILPEISRMAEEAGIAAVIAKPFYPGEILKAIRDVAGKHRECPGIHQAS